jgi:hypothetical protein
LAAPDEVLASKTVTDLVAGSGLRFEDKAAVSLGRSGRPTAVRNSERKRPSKSVVGSLHCRARSLDSSAASGHRVPDALDIDADAGLAMPDLGNQSL